MGVGIPVGIRFPREFHEMGIAFGLLMGMGMGIMSRDRGMGIAHM